MKGHNMKNSVKYVYVRDEKKNPVGCVAYQVHDGHFYYGWSVHNPADQFDRKLARTIAEGRLQKRLESNLPTIKSDCKTGTLLLTIMLELAANSTLPVRFRQLARFNHDYFQKRLEQKSAPAENKKEKLEKLSELTSVAVGSLVKDLENSGLSDKQKEGLAKIVSGAVADAFSVLLID
jgi:hypothetical protein